MKKNLSVLMIATAAAVKKSVLLVVVAVSLLGFEVRGQAQLLYDVNEHEETAFNSFTGFTPGNGGLYFIARDRELWISRTTVDNEEETELVKQFVSITNLTMVGSTLYFVADDDVNGPELWKSNGTTNGTFMVKDINPGGIGSVPAELTNVKGTLYFTANDGSKGRELWKSNGTPGGTVLVMDILPKAGNGNPSSLTDVNGAVFFAANNGTHGIELWKSNGTASGTLMIKDIKPGTRVNSSPFDLVNVYGTLFFVAADATGGRELWKSNGTTEGTVRVRDILPGTNNSRIGNGTAVYRTLFFTATDGIHGQELWKSDGTEAGTVMVKDMTPGPEGSQGEAQFTHAMGNFTNIYGTLFFTAYENDTYSIWKSNGTTKGTVPIALAKGPGLAQPKPMFTLMNNRIYYFNERDYEEEYEEDRYALWSMDRNGMDSRVILEFINDYITYYPGLAVVGNSLYTSAITDIWSGFRILKTDGTAQGTTALALLSPTRGSDPNEFTYFDGRIFFRTNHSFYQQHDLWVTDGTPGGTSQFSYYDEEVTHLELVGHNLFAAVLNGFGLYKTDLLVGDPELLVDRDYGKPPIDVLLNTYGTLFFSTVDGELWKSDGTAAGTALLKDFQRINTMNAVNGKLIFKVVLDNQTEELWSSNGTITGTVKIKAFDANRGSYNPTAIVGNTFYFVANGGIHGNEVWKSNGTVSGTAMVADLNTTDAAFAHSEYDIRNLSVFRDTLYISALGDDGEWGLYKSAGASSGTTKLRNLNQVVYSVDTGDELLLFTYEVEAGKPKTHLWTTDGTAEGTQLVSELNTQYGNFSHTLMDDVLYFSTLEGGDLWRTDGTACGTFVVDIGSRGASPIGALDTTLIFGSYDPQAGFEPHAYNTTEAPESPCGNAMAIVNADSGRESTPKKVLSGYPNPFNNEFDLRIEGNDNESAQLRVFTIYGRPVEDISEVKANTNYRIGQTWRPGVYVVQLTRGGKVSRYRVVKE